MSFSIPSVKTEEAEFFFSSVNVAEKHAAMLAKQRSTGLSPVTVVVNKLPNVMRKSELVDHLNKSKKIIIATTDRKVFQPQRGEGKAIVETVELRKMLDAGFFVASGDEVKP